MSATLEDKIGALLAAHPSGLSAADVTRMLRAAGDLPEYWTVLDVAEFMREWFG